jgi:tetratricopeptide (TPR) repeat protein
MSTHDSLWASYVSQSLLAYERGEYEQAQASLEKNLATLNADLNHSDSVKADLLHVLANVYRERDEYEKAEVLYRQAIALKELTQSHSNGLARLYRDWASALIMQNDFREALSAEGSALSIVEANAGVHRFEVQRSLCRLAAIAHTERNYTKAYEYYARLADERKNSSSDDSIRALYADFGSICYHLKKYDEAERYWSLALSVGSKDDDESNALRNDLGLALCAQQKHEQAQPHCRLSAERRHYDKTGAIPDRINDIADVYCEKGEFAQARPLCEAASELRREEQTAFTDPLAIKLQTYCRYVRRLFCCEKNDVIERRIKRLND